MSDIMIPMTAKRTDPFTPETLKPSEVDGKPVGGGREVEFLLRIPTPSERDVLGSRLYELGLSSVADDTMRATMVNELFKIDWVGNSFVPDGPIVVTGAMATAGEEWLKKNSKGSLEDKARGVFGAMLESRAAQLADNDTYAETQAEFLDGYWIRQQAEQKAMALWTEQEAQRMLDAANGVEWPPLELPRRTISIREHSRAKLLVDEIQQRSQVVRSLGSRRMDYGARNALLMVRLHVLEMAPKGDDWPEDLVIEREKSGLLTVEFTDRLRDHIGPVAWSELVARCDSHYALSEAERKNFGLPPEKQSDQTGSPERSGDGASSDGNVTASSTGPVPAGE